MIGNGDTSNDTPITEGTRHPLIEEQETTAQEVTPEALAARLAQGGEQISKKKKRPAPKDGASGSNSSVSSLDSWMDAEQQQKKPANDEDDEADLTEAEIQQRLADDEAATRKAIALKKKKLAIQRSKAVADAKRKAKVPVKSLKQRLEEQRAALVSEAEKEDAVLIAAHKEKLKAAARPSRRNTMPRSSGRTCTDEQWSA